MAMALSAFAPQEIYFNKHYHDDSDSLKDSYCGYYGANEQFRSKLTAKELVFQVLKNRVDNIDVDRCCPGAEDPFFVADMGEIYRQHLRWKMNLSRVKPFYGRSRRCGRARGCSSVLTIIPPNSGQVQPRSGDPSPHGFPR